jgi:hypothetical protein
VTEIGRALPPVRPRPPAGHLFMPKLVTAFREGCGSADLRSDSIAGLAVAAEVVSVQQGIQLIEEDVDGFARPRTDYTQNGSQPFLQFADSFEAAFSSMRQAP